MFLEKYTDEALCVLVQEGSDEATTILLHRYKWLVSVKARSLFLVGGDREDILQEGMIGLYFATKNYLPSKNDRFIKFAELCITRQMFSAIRRANRLKHQPLNQSISVESLPTHQMDWLEGQGVSGRDDPEDLVVFKEMMRQLLEELQPLLSPLEKDVLTFFLEGNDYLQIATTLNRNPKSIDNAWQRVKKKAMQLPSFEKFQSYIDS